MYTICKLLKLQALNLLEIVCYAVKINVVMYK